MSLTTIIFAVLFCLNEVECHFYPSPDSGTFHLHSVSKPSITFSDDHNYDNWDSAPYQDNQVVTISSLGRGSSSSSSSWKKKIENRIWSSSLTSASRRFERVLFEPKSQYQSTNPSVTHLARFKRSDGPVPLLLLPPQPVPFFTVPHPGSSAITSALQSTLHQQLSEDQMERRRQPYFPSKHRLPYKHYRENDCEYHTLVNGDSEIILRKLLPIRLVGRTIVRHCIEKPNFNDPRYKVLLKGNNKSSFGSIRFQMVQ